MMLDALLYLALATAGVSTLLVVTLGTISPQAPARIEVEGAQVVQLEGGTIRYQSVGDGDEALLLLHGFNSQLAIWSEVWAQLGECGRKLRLDEPGFGGSKWHADSFSLQEQAARLIAFLDFMHIARVTLVGVSMGGSLAAWIGAHYPDRVKGLVLLAPSAYPGALRGRGLFAKLYGSSLFNRLATQLAASRIFRRLYPESSALQALTVTASYGEPWAQALEKIQVPTWLLWSCGDECVPFCYADEIAASIRGSTFVRLPPEIGHDIPGNRPELIATIASRVHGHLDSRTSTADQSSTSATR